jgi:hypothetical protein
VCGNFVANFRSIPTYSNWCLSQHKAVSKVHFASRSHAK